MTAVEMINTGWPRVSLAGVPVDLLDTEPAVALIGRRARYGSDSGRPLSVVSANLDHLAQFGSSGRWFDTLDYRLGAVGGPGDEVDHDQESTLSPPGSDWLTLLDGAPLVVEASRLTGRAWPRLAGSDLIGPLLDRAEADGTTVGFLGGSYVIQRLLSRQLTRTRPGLIVSGLWAPDRAELADPEASRELAATIASSGTQLLVVGLGKPRQELWMAKYGLATGANVLLAFGAVVDFLAGGVRRAPQWAAGHGLEWAWRLALEPRRLARRYLIDDPPSLIQLRRDSRLLDAAEPAGDGRPYSDRPASAESSPEQVLIGTADGRFVAAGEQADVVVHVVTYNSAGAIGQLLRSLRADARMLRLRVIVVDNASTDGTLDALSGLDDVTIISTGGNLGYAGGINAALHRSRTAEAVLVLNPDLEVVPGAVRALFLRMRRSGAGIVVPRLLSDDGSVYPSVRHEPTVLAAFGDAVLGSHLPGRPRALSEIEFNRESYQHPHRIAWATGAALLVRAELAERLGDWDEQFFQYSDDTDYCRRARELGDTIWYEPSAVVKFGPELISQPSELTALMAINRIRYVRKHRPRPYARWFFRTVVLAETLRAWKPDRHGVLATVVDEGTWDQLPRHRRAEPSARTLDQFPTGSVIIPAHNEAEVIGRTLQHLLPALASGRIEVIVACNGCTDRTAEIARSFGDVRVLEVGEASKITALNAADAVATHWPRIYLDADIELDPLALRMVLDRLHRGRVLAARPAFHYQDKDASPPVRAFYRARRRIGSTRSAMWGAGVYGLTVEGHERFGSFPPVVADDLFLDDQFSAEEKVVVPTSPVTVHTPRTSAALLRILHRNYRGQADLVQQRSSGTVEPIKGRPHNTADTARELIASVHGPWSAIDAFAYAAFVAAARLWRTPASAPSWERDETSRAEGGPA
ncbi:WecB/TagA/CpsF family glycosyltransferase [Microlunatus elymi]|uniref:WecB/TagA/CpsF family glycosyltransferase n=1 Tax=Microlunatus elymi TaxID=2596828 RepID=A0A516PTX3_9ACTN|nr:WecB/TagA/CpsF family glycosyltransferase [Microlunatus elymi]QDP94589.1 WecB/TagA/CpsF family glycosyltransferase [Microlunatus elymi]